MPLRRKLGITPAGLARTSEKRMLEARSTIAGLEAHMLERILLSLFILTIAAGIPLAHVHRTQAIGSSPATEYDYTKSDAKSCCNNSDCRPALEYYSDGTFYHFWVEPKPAEKQHGYAARWVKVPVPEVRPNDLFGDRKAHWCGDLYANAYNTRCAFVPPKREMT